MKSKYASVQPDYKNTIALLVRETGWSAETTENVVGLLMQASEEKASAVAEEKRMSQKDAKYLTTKTLLEKYRLLKVSIESGTEHTLKLLADTEYQRLMQLEESAQNQDARSMAVQTARNRVLLAQIDTALDCLKELCDNSKSSRVKRQYTLLYARYIDTQEQTVEEIMDEYGIERTCYFTTLKSAMETLSVLLFGVENAEDFIASRTDSKECQ